jgi:hypothetical protein
MRLSSWDDVRSWLDSQPPGTMIRLPKWHLPHPTSAGATRSVGLPFGQSANYCWRISTTSGLFAREFADFYEVHADRARLDEGRLLAEDEAAGALLAGAGAVGGLLGAVLGRSKEATMVGAGLAVLVGALALGLESEQGRE